MTRLACEQDGRVWGGIYATWFCFRFLGTFLGKNIFLFSAFWTLPFVYCWTYFVNFKVVVAQLLSHVWLFVTSRTVASQAPLSSTVSQSLKYMCFKSCGFGREQIRVASFNHLNSEISCSSHHVWECRSIPWVYNQSTFVKIKAIWKENKLYVCICVW